MAKTAKQIQAEFDETREKEKELLANSSNGQPEAPKFDDEEKPRQKLERPEGLEVVASGAGYHDFNKEPVFQGYYIGEFLAPKDIPANRTKQGDCIGYTMKNALTGREEIISNSYTIMESFKKDNFNPATKWYIEFEGKTLVKGKPFNKFFTAKMK